MKNVYFILCMVFSPFLLLGQMNSSIDIAGGYDVMHSVVFSNNIILGVNKKRENDIQKRTNFRIGINANFRVFDNMMFKTGVRYAKLSYLEDSFVIEHPDMTFSYDHFFVYYDEYYVEIPILFRYEFQKKKYDFFIEAGVSPHLYLSGKQITDHELLYFSSEYSSWESTDTETDFDTVLDIDSPTFEDARVRLAYVFGIGLNYKLSSKTQLFIQPTFRLYPGLLNADAMPFSRIVLKSRTVGVEIGVRRAMNFVNFSSS